MATSDDLLNLLVSQRSATFRFRLLDDDLTPQGFLKPDNTSSVPSIAMSVSRAIMRDLRGLKIPPAQAADINTAKSRVVPEMLLENGDSYPLGLFVFSDASRVQNTYGQMLNASLVDQTFILDQEIEEGIGYPSGTSVRPKLEELFETSGILNYSIDDFGTRTSGPLNFPAGRSRLDVMNTLCDIAGCYPVYSNNAGICRVQSQESLEDVDPTVIYKTGQNIFNGSIIETSDLLNCPNRYTVIDSGANASPIVGMYEVPSSAPHSVYNRGFAIPKVISIQGLENATAARAMAKARAQADVADFSGLSFQGAPDPRHDTFDVLTVDTVRYREIGWSMTLAEGSPMQHDLLRIYPEDVAA